MLNDGKESSLEKESRDYVRRSMDWSTQAKRNESSDPGMGAVILTGIVALSIGGYILYTVGKSMTGISYQPKKPTHSEFYAKNSIDEIIVLAGDPYGI